MSDSRFFTLWTAVRTWWRPSPPMQLFPPLPPEQRECPHCKEIVYIWRTYADGTMSCVGCEPFHLRS